jgi:hypothetical protein
MRSQLSPATNLMSLQRATVQAPRSKAFQVRKYGCAAEIASAPDGTTLVLARPGWLLGGQIARLLDRGYQKFLKTRSWRFPRPRTTCARSTSSAKS